MTDQPILDFLDPHIGIAERGENRRIREKVNTNTRARYKRNPEKVKTSTRDWQQRNYERRKPELIAKNREWRRRNPEKVNWHCWRYNQSEKGMIRHAWAVERKLHG